MVDTDGNKIYSRDMNTTPRTIIATIAVDRVLASKQSIEGPTRKQVAKMQTRCADLKARAQVALAAGDDDLAFTLDCDAFDIECTLRNYCYKVA